MSNLELRIDESSDLSFHAVDFVGVPFAPTVEVEDIEGGHRVSITSMGAEGKKTDEFDVMDGATWLSGNILIGELAEGTVLTTDDAFAAPPKGVEVYGKSTQDGTPTPDAPVPIDSVCNVNILDESTFTDGYFIDASGTITASPVSSISALVAVETNRTYCLSGLTTEGGGNKRVHGYDASGNWVAQLVVVGPVSAGVHYGAKFTVPSGVTQVRLSIYTSDTNVKLELGEYVTPYTPYGVGNVFLSIGETVDLSDTSRWMTSLNSKPRPFISGGSASISYANGRVSMLRYSPSYSLAILIGKLEVGKTYTLYVGDFATVQYSIARASALDGTVTQTLVNSACNRGYISFDVTTTDYYFIVSWMNSTTTLYFENVRLVSHSIPIPLGKHIARSLPDGTRDTLTLSYIGPSTEHEGWGVYRKVLTQNTNTYTVQANLITNISDIGGGYIRGFIYAGLPPTSTSNTGYCTHAPYLAAGTMQLDHAYVVGQTVVLIGSGTTLADLQAAYDGAELVYHLATPITHDLGTVELPILPNPLTAWADGGSAQPTLSMVYEQDINIVIGEIRSAIADMATS